MQTLTHALTGVVVGTIVFPGNTAAQSCCVIASVTPDLVLAPQLVIDKMNGRKPFVVQGKGVVLAKEISHSLPMALLMTILADYYGWQVATFSALCWAMHILLDGMTHTGERYRSTDQTCIWPFEKSFPPLSRVIGVWEYRKDFADLHMKAFEMVFCTFLILLALIFSAK